MAAYGANVKCGRWRQGFCRPESAAVFDADVAALIIAVASDVA